MSRFVQFEKIDPPIIRRSSFGFDSDFEFRISDFESDSSFVIRISSLPLTHPLNTRRYSLLMQNLKVTDIRLLPLIGQTPDGGWDPRFNDPSLNLHTLVEV